MASWIAALLALVTLAVGLIVERGAVWVLIATVAGFASVMLVGSGLLKWFGSRPRG
jgi:hypothetical protein